MLQHNFSSYIHNEICGYENLNGDFISGMKNKETVITRTVDNVKITMSHKYDLKFNLNMFFQQLLEEV